MTRVSEEEEATLRRLFYVYLVLFVMEGGLRKWVFPGLANPLLIVRDPVAILAVALALYHRRFPLNAYVIAVGLAGLYALPFTLALGHGSLPVAVFGLRPWLIHVPAAFVFASVMRPRDVVDVGRILMWITLPVAILVAVQFYSPQSALVNRGIGGDLSGSGFDGAMGYFRPSGMFSFTNGNTAFFLLCGAVCVGLGLRPQSIKRLPLALGSLGVLLAVPVSLSRGYVFGLAVILAFGLLTTVTDRRTFGRALGAGVVLAVVIVAMLNTSVVDVGLEVLTARFTNASVAEGGLRGTLIERALGDIYIPILEAGEGPLWGVGLGLGTNAGASLLAGGGERTLLFVVAEGEWGRVLGEMGPLLGGIVMFARAILVFHLGLRSWRAATRYRDPLAFVLLGAGLFPILKGQWGNPMDLGYATLLIALVIGASRAPGAPPPPS